MRVSSYSADDVRLLRETLGLSLIATKRAFDLAGDPTSGTDGDVIWAACAVEAKGLAINVRGDRNAWNISHGSKMAEAMRRRWPNLNDAFPIRKTSKPAPENCAQCP
jgi:hypothetical protein